MAAPNLESVRERLTAELAIARQELRDCAAAENARRDELDIAKAKLTIAKGKADIAADAVATLELKLSAIEAAK